MPHSKSAEKRLRTSCEANARNRARVSELKTLEKKLQAAVAAGEGAADACKKYVSRLDKAVKAGSIPAGRAANKKSQADKLIASAK